MTVETPDQYGGKPIPEDAIEIALAAEKKKKDGNLGGENTEVEAPSLESFIYVPSVNLYFAKERSHLGKDWDDTHKELQSKGLRMPTIPQFIELLKYLRDNPNDENATLYDEITVLRIPWRANSLDAKFYAKDDEVWVDYNHIVDSHGNVVAQNHERLEGHLMQDRTPGINLEQWLNNATSQGLPPENMQKGDLRYWHPKENGIARFIAGFSGAGLDCRGDPSGSGFSWLGVFACAKNLRGKQ